MNIGLEQGTVSSSDYKDEWGSLFINEATYIRQILNNMELSIEHIGSTSIPGMPSKPIIDLMVAFETMHDATEAVNKLFSNDYIRHANGDLTDRLFLVKGLPEKRTHYISLTTTNSHYWHAHIIFRNCLCNNKQLADECMILKQRLAALHHNDRYSYTDGKLEFVNRVLSSHNLPPNEQG